MAVENFSGWLQSVEELDALNGRLIIDNTKLPIGGAYSEMDVRVMVTI